MEPSFKNDQGSIWLFPDRLIYRSFQEDYCIIQYYKKDLHSIVISYNYYTHLPAEYFIKIDKDSVIFYNSSQQDLSHIFNLISDWILDDTLQPVLPTLEG